MKRGLFGYDGEKARFCGGHRLEGDRAVIVTIFSIVTSIGQSG